MNAYFEWILKHRITILVLFVFVLVLSAVSIPKLPVDAVPDITNVQVVVISRTGPLAPEQIERMVTYPIEQDMNGLQGVTEVRSLSKFGLSLVTVVFEDQTPLYFARQLVAEKLQGISTSLPQGVQTALAPVSTGLGEVFMWTLSLKPNVPQAQWPIDQQLQYLRQIQERVIRPEMKQVAGAAEVDTNGGLNREVHINYDPNVLAREGVTVSEILESVQSAGDSFGGGSINKAGQQVVVRSLSPVKDLTALKQLVVKVRPNGKALRVQDVADVRIDHMQRIGAATALGSETVLGTVLMRVGANSRTVAKDAAARLQLIDLPPEVQVDVVYNRAELVAATIETIQKNLLEGALLVTAILFILLGHLTAALIVASAIPLSMIFALKGMQSFGISANLMSLGAIDFGLLVDASVVFIENIIRHQSRARSPLNAAERFKLIVTASKEVASPVLFGLFIIMLVYVPILTLEGVEGKMFEPMALTVLMALAASLVVAILIIPILAYLFLKGPTNHSNSQAHEKSNGGGEHEPRVFIWIKAAYAPALEFAFRKPVIILSGAVFMFGLSVFGFLSLGSEFIPQLDEGSLVIGVVRDPKQHLTASVKDQIEVENVIKSFPEVKTVFSRMGTPDSGTDPMSPNFADTFVMLNERPKGTSATEWRTKDQLFNDIRQKLLQINPNQEISQTQPIEMRFNEVLEGSRADVSLRFLGPDLDVLLAAATDAEEILADIDGVESVEFDALTGLTRTDTLDVELNSEKIHRSGLTLNDLNLQVETALAGRDVGTFLDSGYQIPIRLHLDEALRDRPEVIRELPVAIGSGSSIPLSRLADLKVEEKVTTIARYFGQRYSAVSINLDGRDVESFVREAREKIANGIKLEPGYKVTWGGQFKNLERAKSKLAWIVPLTLLAVFLLLLRATSSLAQATTIFMAIPLGLAGGVFSLLIRDIHFSVSAAVGFIALSGIVVLNSMVLVGFMNELKSHGLTALEAVREGAHARLRPILITALVASLGFLPMALNTGLGAEVQRPLATVVIGGLITSTLLTLFVVPVLMRWVLSRDRVS